MPSTVNTTIAKTLKAFYADTAFWLEGMIHDDVLISVNDQDAPDIEIETIPDNDTVEILSGYIAVGGVELPNGHLLFGTKDIYPLDDAFALWLKNQTTRFAVIEHDASIDVDALRAHLAAFHPSIKVIA